MNTQPGDVHAHEQGIAAGQSLGEPIFWIAAALCLVAQIAILRAAFAPRADTAGPIPHSPRGAEMLWAIIPAIGLGFLLAATWRAIH